MDDYRAVSRRLLTVIPALYPAMPALCPAIPAPCPVIPAKAGIQKAADAVVTARPRNVHAP